MLTIGRINHQKDSRDKNQKARARVSDQRNNENVERVSGEKIQSNGDGK